MVITMRSEQEIMEMVAKLLEQLKQVEKEGNLKAANWIKQRLVALAWVLEKGNIKTLTFSKKELDFLSAFW